MNKKPQKSNSKYTEDWLPVKSIANGMIILDNNTRVTGVKIRPRNIFILDAITQDNVMVALKNFYNMIDFEFWLLSADRPVDIAGYLAQLQVLYNNTSNTAIRKLIVQDINKANNFMDNNVSDTEYYILFKDNNMESIQKKTDCKSPADFQRLGLLKRNQYLKELKDSGISVRQLNRLTGISRGAINAAINQS